MTSQVGGQPLVSVLIISYNQEAYIAETIESALNQDFEDLEIVVTDDASTDATPNIIAAYARRYPGRIRPLLHRDRAGVTGNCNRGLQACRGRYIAFVGGDDIMLPHKIGRQVGWFEESESRVLCGHQTEVFYDDGSRPPHRFQRKLRSGEGAAKLIRYGTFAACSIMVRANRLPAHGFEDGIPIVSDYLLWVETLARGGSFGYVPGTHARYRRHGSNVSSNSANMIADGVRALELIEQRYPQYRASCRRAYARFKYYPLAIDLMARGQRKQARRAFIKALTIDPTVWRAWQALPKTFL